jgi:serine/threonine protein kinase
LSVTLGNSFPDLFLKTVAYDDVKTDDHPPPSLALVMPRLPECLAEMEMEFPVKVLHRELDRLRQAVTRIHQAKYVHMDIKSANVLISSDGNIAHIHLLK